MRTEVGSISDMLSTAIGYNAFVDVSNKIRLGNNSVTVLECQVPLTVTSDGRFKIDVTETIPGLEFISKLRPVQYRFDMDKMAEILNIPNNARSKQGEKTQGEILKTGFIAQEVEQAAEEIGYDFDGVNKPQNGRGAYGLSYASFVVPLVKAVQEQQALIQEQQAVTQEQQAVIQEQQAVIQEQQAVTQEQQAVIQEQQRLMNEFGKALQKQQKTIDQLQKDIDDLKS